jgi:hypothetical protein
MHQCIQFAEKGRYGRIVARIPAHLDQPAVALPRVKETVAAIMFLLARGGRSSCLLQVDLSLLSPAAGSICRIKSGKLGRSLVALQVRTLPCTC